MINAIFGKKIGMTQIFNEEDKLIPVTVIQAEPNTVCQVKTKATDGYEAVTADSLKGHKVRTYSTATASFVMALGGTPSSISLSETYTALSTNLVDGLVTSTLFGYNSGVFDYVDAVNVWEISSSTDGLICSMEALQQLPDDVRDIFQRIMHDSATAPEMLEIDKNDELLAKLEEQGVKVLTPEDDFRDSIRDQLEETVWNDWLKDAGEEGQQVLEQIKGML